MTSKPPAPAAAPAMLTNPSHPPPPPTNHPNPASPPTKRDLKSWWKGFKLPSKHQEQQDTRPRGIFGVPLRQSITYANVAISLVDENGESYIYGYVPIVVAKCGVFLKEKATGIEGIFRLSGSEKRIKELKQAFDSPDRYGKGLVWDGYTVHDAANVLRRYLNDLPEPVVPLDLYEQFREPLRGATKAAVGDSEGPQLIDNFDMNAAIAEYQRLITLLPPLNKQLMLYILDLLAVFAAKADENRMNSQNLAAIFQPGMLSHPNHAMAPEEYRLNQCVIIFLIENQDHFLIGMQGTEADEKTKQEVQQGMPGPEPQTPNAKRSSGVARSSSNASAGAESVARDGKLRRNRSVSSRHSRQSNGGPTPDSPAAALTVTPTSGLARSNTVPSKKSPALGTGRFGKRSGDQASSPVTPLTPLGTSPAGALPPTLHEVTTPPEEDPPQFLSPSAAAVGASHMMVEQGTTQPRMQEGLLEPTPEVVTPSKERKLTSLFQRSPGDNDGRQPNKLRKKRMPGSANPSAHSSVASLTHSAVASPSQELGNPMDAPPQPAPTTIEEVTQPEPQHKTLPAQTAQAATIETPSEPTPRASQIPTGDNLPVSGSGNLLKPTSRPGSLHSSFNEGSDMDQVDDVPATAGQPGVENEKKKRRSFFSRRHDDTSTSSVPPPLASPRQNIGGNTHAEMSTSTVGSGSASKPRHSMAGDSEPTLANTEANSELTKENEKESKNFIGRLKNKFRDAKENHERHKSPPGDRSSLSTILPSRGKSLDIKRATEEEKTAPSAALPAVAPAAAPTAPPAAPPVAPLSAHPVQENKPPQ